MVIYVDLRKDGKIESWGTSPASNKSIKVKLEEDHPLLDDMPLKYELLNGEVVKSLDSERTEAREIIPHKIKVLSENCHKHIVSGFEIPVRGSMLRFSYDLDNQQNFTDTMRLFENNMITSVGWNAYVDSKKVRVQLNKSEFEDVYLAGIKHKTDCLTTLNDYLIPMVRAAETLDEIERVVWNDKLLSGEFSADSTNTLDKKAEKAEQTGRRNTSGILELTNLILSGGM